MTAGPRLRHAALITVVGYVMSWGVPFASFNSFSSQFAFSLIIFGVYLMLLAWLIHRSGYMPRWLAIAVAIAGAGWSIMESGPYLMPGIDLGFLFVATLGELLLLVWLIGWGTRLREPIANLASS